MLIRDVYGRLRFAVNIDKRDYPQASRNLLEAAGKRLGDFASPGGVLFRDDFTDADALFGHEDWHQTLVPGGESAEGTVVSELAIRLLDRQIIGQEWLRAASEPGAAKPQAPRVVFYALKGGVGRSTALVMLAYRLAREGKRVLLFDFDLESPGLSGMLLPPDRAAAFGLVDWFVEDAVGQGDGVLQDIVADSPLAEHLDGAIRVAATMGQGEFGYLAKLARVYADVPRPKGPERFAARMQRVVSELAEREKPDIILIDSRAGLHDLGAISIGSLADEALLFAADSAQTWQGYRQLFGHWQQRPDVLRNVRGRLQIVQALFPETDQEARARQFLEKSYDLFRESLYDQIDPGAQTVADGFTFDLEDEAAPHFPLRVRWNARFQEFNPLVSVQKGGIGDEEIELAFGHFVQGLKSRLLGA